MTTRRAKVGLASSFSASHGRSFSGTRRDSPGPPPERGPKRASIAREAEQGLPENADGAQSLRFLAVCLLDSVLHWWIWIVLPFYAIAVGYVTGGHR